MREPTRREFLASAAVAALPCRRDDPPQSLVCITLDLEMSRNFPTRDRLHWDYEKGNLDDDTKRYAVEAARRVKAAGGRVHFFALGRTMEQEDVSWLEGIARDGHPIGNHTYDHVNVLAKRPEDVQFRFQRAPWLIAGKSVDQAIADNIQISSDALRARAGIEVAGFRTPGGFHDGLRGREDLQRMLLAQGYRWVSSLYPPHPTTEPGVEPTDELADAIAASNVQPFRYPTGLVELPMSPISDIGAFRTGRWRLESFLKVIRRGVERSIDRGEVFDFLGHPSCLLVADPEFRTIDLILELVAGTSGRARIADLGAAADRAG